MRNSKMKNVREQWKQSRFCIGKNKVMAMALGRTPEEEYRPNLHKVGQMLVGERGLLFTNKSVDEVTNWFQSYSEGDYARSGNIATEDVILPEGPLPQFPHSLESYLRQLGLPTTLKKGVIHLVKEHVVCTEGDRLSPETARILKLLGYEMAEFRVGIMSVWSQDGSFVNLQSDTCDPESKENAAPPQKSFMKEDFELAKDCVLLGDDDDDDEMEVAEDDSENENKFSNHSEKKVESKNVEKTEKEIEVLEIAKQQMPNVEKSFKEAGESLEIIPCDLDDKQKPQQAKSSSNKKGKKSIAESGDREPLEIIPCDLDEKQEPEKAKSSSKKKGKKSIAESGDREPLEIIPCDLDEKQEPEQAKSSSKKKGKKGDRESLELISRDSECIEIISSDFEEKQEKVKQNAAKNKAKSTKEEKQIDVDETSQNNTNSEEKISDKSKNDVKNSSPTIDLETEDIEMEVEEIQEPEVKKPKSDSIIKKPGRKPRKTANNQDAKTEETDSAAILKLTEKKLEECIEKPKKFSPKMTRARAAAANKKIKTPEPLETKRSSRKRKM
ncbi:unnamed protein product [Larinioides sclopetarius]|uniref:Large ribosomal subunit protein uL10-like insertion domain-containing protein n=1 Tax=Larinioides sclopetarius TaxID=280406 RepID=A0AAV2AY91_9ARAC